MKKTLLAFPIIFLLLTACGDKGKTGDPDTKDTTQTGKDKTEIKKERHGKYGVKSGVITFRSKILGMEQTQTTYCDDYGEKEANDSYMELKMMGQVSKTHNRTINRDRMVYSLDLMKKTGTKMAVPKVLPGQNNDGKFDFDAMSEQMMKDMNITKKGS